MQLDDKMIDKIAQLARLNIDPDEREALLADMNRILGFVEKLQEVDTEGVQPLIYMNNDAHISRNDEVKDQLTPEQALVNGPRHNQNYFEVPKVIRKKL